MPELSRKECNSFYLLLLSCPNAATRNAVVPGLPAAQYQDALEQGAGLPAAGFVAGPAPDPAENDAAEELFVADDAPSDDGGGAGGGGGIAAPPAAASSDDGSSSASSDSDDEGDAIAEDEGAHVVHEAVPFEVPPTLLGMPLKVDRYKGLYVRLIVRCNNPAHGPKCKKRRGVGVNQRYLGDRQPLAFLACWLQESHDKASAATHIPWKPSDAAQIAWLAANPGP